MKSLIIFTIKQISLSNLITWDLFENFFMEKVLEPSLFPNFDKLWKTKDPHSIDIEGWVLLGQSSVPSHKSLISLK
jgi:hypothetical protein